MLPSPSFTGRTALSLFLVVSACSPPPSQRSATPSASVAVPAPPSIASSVALDANSPKPAPSPSVRLKAALQPSPLASIVWSGDGKAIATFCGPSCRWGPEHQRRVVVWSVPALEVKADVSPNKDDMGEGKIHNVAFTKDGARLGTSTHNEIQVFDRDGYKLMTRIGLNAVYEAWRWSPDARHLAASDAYGHGVLVDAASGAKKKDLQLHNGAASYSSSVVWSADGAWAAIEGNNLVRLADMRGGAIKLSSKVISGKDNTAVATALSRDGQWFAIVDTTGRVELWSTAAPALRKVLVAGGAGPNAPAGRRIAFSPREDRLAVLYGDGSVRVWEVASRSGDLASSEVRPRRAGLQDASLATLVWSADGRYLAWALDPDHSFGFWDAQGSSPSVTLGADARRGQASIRMSPVGHWLARADGQNVEVWDIDARRVQQRMAAAVVESGGLAFSPDASVLAAADGDVHFLRIKDGATLTLRSLGIAKSRRSLQVASWGGFTGDADLAKQDLEREGGSKLTSEDLAASDAGLGARFFGELRQEDGKGGRKDQ